MYISKCLPASIVVATLAAGWLAANANADVGTPNPISVTIDSQPLSFSGTQPMELHGSVLVPLRGVFEALHARVDYDPSTSTITAHRPGRTVVVPIGSSTATINGQSQPLSQPATVYGGSTMVPLRFVAEALGDYVEWSAQTHTVMIQREHGIRTGDNSVAEDTDASNETIVTGTVTRIVNDQDHPRIAVTSYGVVHVIDLAPDVTISRGQTLETATSAALSDLQPGDRVRIRENDHAHAVSIAATIGHRSDQSP